MGGFFAFLAALAGPILKLFGYNKSELSKEAQSAATAATATTQLQTEKQNAVTHQQAAQAARDFDRGIADDPDSLWNDDGHQVHHD